MRQIALDVGVAVPEVGLHIDVDPSWGAGGVVAAERNPHDLVVDMKREYLGYENNLALVEALHADP